MFLEKYIAFDWERLPWVGGCALFVSLIPAIGLLIPFSSDWVCPASAESRVQEPISLDIQMALKSSYDSVSAGDAKDQISFSVDPPYPSTQGAALRIMVRLNRTKQVKRVEVPCRLGLQFSENGLLQFSGEKSLFWLDIQEPSQGGYKAFLSFLDPLTGKEQKNEWTVVPQETPVQTSEEFLPGTPFRILAETRWWGPDLFMEQYGKGGGIQRLEVGSPSLCNVIDLGQDEWLVYRNRKWEQLTTIAEASGDPVARVRKVLNQSLELEGWDGESHVRLNLPLFPSPPSKLKGEEIFSQLRVRSEKQISCTLDKQCLILRPGDWVVKVDQRWRILRKKEEKEAFMDGDLMGDLFVLDRIDAKGAVKSIAGHYFNATRSQKALIEYSAPQSRASRGKGGGGKSGEGLMQKTRGKNR